jgi:hypothetical protein
MSTVRVHGASVEAIARQVAAQAHPRQRALAQLARGGRVNQAARQSFERTLAAIVRERTGSAWELERLRHPAPTPHGKLGRLSSPERKGALVHVGASSDKDAVKG